MKGTRQEDELVFSMLRKTDKTGRWMNRCLVYPKRLDRKIEELVSLVYPNEKNYRQGEDELVFSTCILNERD
jgi:hypothetical protein